MSKAPKEEMKLASLIEARVKERDRMGMQLKKEIESFAKRVNELVDHDLETYEMLNSPDCLYYDSPLSRIHTWNWIKQCMIKNDLDFVGYFLDGKVNIVDLMERVTDGSKWILRFTKEPEKKKTGLEAIL